jgi:hypothetical protein
MTEWNNATVDEQEDLLKSRFGLTLCDYVRRRSNLVVPDAELNASKFYTAWGRESGEFTFAQVREIESFTPLTTVTRFLPNHLSINLVEHCGRERIVLNNALKRANHWNDRTTRNARRRELYKEKKIDQEVVIERVMRSTHRVLLDGVSSSK